MSQKRTRGNVRPHGQIRQSQIVTTFGPGAMVDLPDHSVIIAGLEEWSGYRDRPIDEPRLAAKVRAAVGVPSAEFYAPPADNDDPSAPVTGITAWLFPEWFVAQYEERDPQTGTRSRPLVHRLDLERGRRYCRARGEKSVKVVPIRFVQACVRGHVSDIDWRLFVHGKGDQCQRPLWLDERGTTGDLTDVMVRCECGKAKALSAATRQADLPLGYCNGPRPWLGAYSREKCGGADEGAMPNRLLVRSASNAYFSQTLSVISIPEPDSKVRTAVEEVWADFLQYCESLEDVARERRKKKVSPALESCSDAEVWAEIERRRRGPVSETVGIRQAEFETLMKSPDQAGEDAPEGVFFARTIQMPTGEPSLTKPLSRVVKVYRLREVIAQIGFTRFEAPVADVNGELALGVERAPLSLNQSWFPAVENRGEGIFLGFRSDRLEEWARRPAVQARGLQLLEGFTAWKSAHPGTKAEFPGLPYVMLHTLSHLLVTAVSLDCGYASSSIRERIYVVDGGHGTLLYTASPDAEGTLGGLVEAADRIDGYLRQALDLGRLCSNDPVCSQHRADRREEDRLLLGAACHGCVLLPESSCERRNDFLDRALVVPTVDGTEAAFFDVYEF